MSTDSDSDLERAASTPLDPEILARVDSKKLTARRAPWQARTTDFQLILLNSTQVGHGTDESPYIIDWLDGDREDPQGWRPAYKWFCTMVVALATLAVSFNSSAYSGSVVQIIEQFHCSQEVAILGISLFVLGFAIGPLFWAPISEVLGRRQLFIWTYCALTIFCAAAGGSQNIQTLIILRFFAGSFGSSPLTNAGGTISDIFDAESRGLAMAVFACCPFLGPVIGPIVGGFASEAIGWRWVEGLTAILSGFLLIMGTLFLPETYAPVLLRRRAAKLEKATGKIYRSKYESKGKVALGKLFRVALSRPWFLLFREPIVFILSVYMAIIYGTLYMLFSAYPVVYQQYRGWSQGQGGLAFIGVAIGMLTASALTVPDNNIRYRKVARQFNGFAPPEERLPPVMLGGLLLPIGLFWFSWTNGPDIPWPASVAAGIPFGAGMVFVFLAIMNYLIDAYLIYAASVLAANSVMRSLFGCVFPLFTNQMYNKLGIHWASSIPAFLALACAPFPFLFYRYGARIRSWTKFGAEAMEFAKKMQSRNAQNKEAPPEKEKQAQ